MPLDVGKIIRTTREAFPIGYQTPENVRLIWQTTMNVWDPVRATWIRSLERSSAGQIPPIRSDSQQDIDRQAAEFEQRMLEYKGWIERAQTEPQLFPVTPGLINGRAEDLGHMPDVATPAHISNQIAALLELEDIDIQTANAYEHQMESYAPFLQSTPEGEKPSVPVPVGTPNGVPFPLILAGGAAVYFLFLRGRRK